MRRLYLYFRPLTLVGIAGLFFLTSCDPNDLLPFPDFDLDPDPVISEVCNVQNSPFLVMDSDPLNDSEISGVLFMREEEKLARDVYLNLFEKWGFQVFDNISRSEQCHMDAMALVLDRYNLPDPAALMERGEFFNTDLQALYDQLIERGLADEIEGLKVGAFIEETDIIDIQNEIDNLEGNEDIKFIYTNLLNGSKNHLRAFVGNLAAQGVTYEPVILDQETLDEINGN